MKELRELKKCRDYKALKHELTQGELEKIEQEIQEYLNMTTEETEEIEFLSDAVNWYVGAISTRDFVECLIDFR